MLLEETVSNPSAPITLDEAKVVLRKGLWGDDPALRLVVQDATRAENFEKSKSWVMGWNIASALYQSPFATRYWEGTQVERANVPFYTLATAVNGIVPQILNGLFYEDPPFMIEERPGTTAQEARAWSALIAYQLQEINFREECRLGVANVALFGTGIWKWGWESYTQKRKIYSLKNDPLSLPNPLPGEEPVQITDDEIEYEEVEEPIDRPTFEHIVNLGHVLVDPGCNRPDIRRAKFVVHRMFMTFDDLDKLRDRPGFELPSREELLALFFPPVETAESDTGAVNDLLGGLSAKAEPRDEATTVDPFAEPLEVLERWDNKRYVVVLQKKMVICNDENPYGTIPFLSVNWWDVPESFWGMGLAKTIGSEQRLQQGITNTWLDQAALNLNGVFTRVRGKTIPTQSIRMAPGKIIDVENAGDFAPMPRTAAVPEAGMHIQMSQSRAEQVSGTTEAASSGVAGSSGHSNLARSSAGANLLAAGSGNRNADFVEKFSTQVIVPLLAQFMEMDKAMLPISALRGILSDELEHEYMKDSGDLVALLNAKAKFNIAAGAKMQARRGMAQALPMMAQYLSNQEVTGQLAIEGKKVNVEELLRMFFETSDWKNFRDVIVPMTPEDMQRQQANSPMAAQQAKAQGQQQLMEQQFEHKEQLADNENIARAGRDVLRQTMEKSMTPLALTGEPGNVGFGAV